jgi:thioredoxin reductase (NADPH)
MSDYLIREIAARANIDVRFHTRIVDGIGEDRLQALVLEIGTAAERETLPVSALFVLIGAHPRTDWLLESIARDSHGFILTGPRRAALRESGIAPDSRPPLLHETSMAGVFAVGDVRHGSVKRVASAVGEGGVVVHSIHQYLATLVR